MPFSRPTLSQLITRIEGDITSRLTGGAALMRRSVLAILARVLAGGWHALYGYLQDLSVNILPAGATGDFLDRYATAYGIPRLAAAFATGTAVFTGTNGTAIPSGTLLAADDGTQFKTTAGGTISSGTATIAIQAVVAGAAGNVTAVTLSLVSPISNIGSSATAITTGGADLEVDDALRARILARIQNPPAGGSANDYKTWALANAGVAHAYVFPLYYGDGTVAVVITATGGSPVASGGLIASVLAYITDPSRAPVTAKVTVATVNPRVVAMTIGIKPNNSSIQAAVTSALQTLFAFDPTPGGTLLLSHILQAIETAGGLTDSAVTAITLDGVSQPIANIALTGFDYAVLGTLTFTTIP